MLTRTSTILLEGLKNSADQQAWREFDERYRPLILAVAARSGLHAGEADDAAQETMIAFLETYRESRYDRQKGRLRDWLRGIACHKVRDIQRRQGHREKPLADVTHGTDVLAQVEDTAAEAAWDEEWDNAVLRQCLQEVRQQVEPRTFEAFELFALQDWPAKRVAAHLQLSEDVVYQSKSRILTRIREQLPTLTEIW
jgi:RNA polymerase sigma-70 factor (ECF subfamily)